MDCASGRLSVRSAAFDMDEFAMLCYDAVYLRCILPERCSTPVADLNCFFPEKTAKATAGCGDVNRK